MFIATADVPSLCSGHKLSAEATFALKSNKIRLVINYWTRLYTQHKDQEHEDTLRQKKTFAWEFHVSCVCPRTCDSWEVINMSHDASEKGDKKENNSYSERLLRSPNKKPVSSFHDCYCFYWRFLTVPTDAFTEGCGVHEEEELWVWLTGDAAVNSDSSEQLPTPTDYSWHFVLFIRTLNRFPQHQTQKNCTTKLIYLYET